MTPPPPGPTAADDPADDYAAAGFGSPLPWGPRPALVVVDAVQAYVDPACPLYAGAMAEAAGLRMPELVEAARASGVPVFFTHMDLDEDGSNAGHFFTKAVLTPFLPGNPAGAPLEGLEPLAGETRVAKQYPSAFFGTTLDAGLRAAAIDTVVLIGFSTSGCVRASALDALQHGYVPIVVTDAVADRNQGIHDANLFDIGQKMAELSDVEAVSSYFAASRSDLPDGGGGSSVPH
jgi:maleamate amidohydrolase